MERRVDTVLGALQDLKKEGVLNKTLKGLQLQEVVDYLIRLDRWQIGELSVKLCDELEHCLPSKGKCMLPNQMWRAFHQIRLSDKLKETWSKSIMYASLPTHLTAHADLCFPLVVDRVFKHMIAQKKGPTCPTAPDENTLCVREENVVRYMAGYVSIF